jgi:hypothetical protein
MDTLHSMLHWSKSRKGTGVRLFSFSSRRELERQMRWRGRAKVGKEEENFENRSIGVIAYIILETSTEC